MAFRPLRHDGRLAATRWSRSARWFSAAASTVMTRLTVADARLFVRPSRQLRNSSASSSTLAGRVLLDGSVVHVADIRADPDFAVPEAVAAGNHTVFGVPLLREGAVLSTINLSRKRVESFTERQ